MNFKVVIPALNANNLIHCVRALMKNELNLPRDHIIVVDDGARREAEAQLPGITWVTGVKPFIFARNVNLGIRQAGTDVMLVGDDAQLTTPLGFTHLMWQLIHQPQLGVCSAAIDGFVVNPRQRAGLSKVWRDEEDMLAFISVGIPWAVYQSVGPLDERFDGYGFEDNDYCMRIKRAGYKLGIWGGCVVEHAILPSSFRTRADIQSRFEHNRRLYDEKWRQHGLSPRA